MPAASISGSRYSVKSGSLRAQSARWRWLNRLAGHGEGWRSCQFRNGECFFKGDISHLGSVSFIGRNELCWSR